MAGAAMGVFVRATPSHLDLPAGVEQQVLGLDVTMHDLAAVHVVEAEDDGGDVVPRLLLRETPAWAVRQLVVQITAQAHVHDDVQVAVVLEGVMHVHHLRAMQPRQQVPLLHHHGHVVAFQDD